jgi:hypothetical protein
MILLKTAAGFQESHSNVARDSNGSEIVLFPHVLHFTLSLFLPRLTLLEDLVSGTAVHFHQYHLNRVLGFNELRQVHFRTVSRFNLSLFRRRSRFFVNHVSAVMILLVVVFRNTL